jgi:hypothetical protein
MMGQFTLKANATESKKKIQRLCTVQVSHAYQIGQN